jgi:hypothetical protein
VAPEPAFPLLRLAHLALGFATAFAIAPFALCAVPGSRAHRRAGKLYVVCMCLLFASGMVFTFTKHELLSYKWARNFAFNTLGFLLLFPGVRALRMRAGADRLIAQPLDRALSAALAALSLALLALGPRKWPLFLFGALGLAFVWLDWRETSGAAPVRSVDRHVRYMLSSYFYVLTVVSLVYGPAGSELKWVWPLALGAIVVPLATSRRLRARLRIPRVRAQVRAGRFAAAVGAGVAALVALQIARTGELAPSAQDRDRPVAEAGATPRSPAIAAAP